MAYSVIPKPKLQAINGIGQWEDAISGVAYVRSVTFRDGYEKQCPPQRNLCETASIG